DRGPGAGGSTGRRGGREADRRWWRRRDRRAMPGRDRPGRGRHAGRGLRGATGGTAMNEARDAVVSSDSEELILVDLDDREIGFDTKERCHDGDGILHRAFSVFLLDAEGRIL